MVVQQLKRAGKLRYLSMSMNVVKRVGITSVYNFQRFLLHTINPSSNLIALQ